MGQAESKSDDQSAVQVFQPHKLFVYGFEDIDEMVAMYYPPTIGQSGPDYVTLLLQDANLNVVGEASWTNGSMLYQFRYHPYGDYLAYENVWTGALLDWENTTTPLWQPFGHQGLYFDQESRQYYSRGRYYIPPLGRFDRVDPNGTGLILAASLGYHGQTPSASLSFSAFAQYDDGLNPFTAYASNPINRTDSTGLSSDFDWMYESEDAENDVIGSRLYALGAINEGAKWASLRG